MERYSKEFSTKWQSKYSEEFKRFVCNEYLSGSLTKKDLAGNRKPHKSNLQGFLL